MKLKTKGTIKIVIGTVLIIRAFERDYDFSATESAYEISTLAITILIPILAIFMLYSGYKDIKLSKLYD
jgi:hypothetical protein